MAKPEELLSLRSLIIIMYTFVSCNLWQFTVKMSTIGDSKHFISRKIDCLKKAIFSHEGGV